MTDVQSESPTATDDSLKGYLLWLTLAAAIIVLDQISKLAVIHTLEVNGRITGALPFLNITHHQNPGAAFSFLADAGGWQRWFFTALATVVSIVIAVWIYRLQRSRFWVLTLGLSLVLGGAIGNLIDRVRLGYVTDFIQVMFGSWAFPSFNIADSAITVGAVFLIIDALFISGRSSTSDP